jgi:branched-chain amino acid transport system ATP-binding protein
MLVVHNIRKHFGGLAALDDVSFEVTQGTITSVIGPNGAGKTTLFNIVSGLLPPTTGSITFQEAEVTGWPPHRIAGRAEPHVPEYSTLPHPQCP